MKTLLHSILIAGIAFLSTHAGYAQGNQIRESPKARITQFMGKDTRITIEYGRPAVKGRKVWGELVPYGLSEGNRYSNNNPYPWRAGANENTTIEFNNDLKIEGQVIPAGTYSIHMIPSESEWVVIFNKNSQLWGSYQYKQEEDALRVTVTPREGPFQELLTYGFENITKNSGVAYLHWEKLKVPFAIEL